jgi:hypothetical protein
VTVSAFFGKAKMTINYLKYFMAVMLLAYIGGCAHTFAPSVREEFEPGKIPDFSSKNEVTLQNVQTDSEPVTFMRAGVHYYLANRQECTDVAVAIVKREITKRGMQAVANNARNLKLSVVSMNTDMGMWSSDVVVHMTAQTGNGYTADFEGRGNTGPTIYGVHYGADVALSEAVVAMLKDPKIVEYLTK